MPRQLSQDIDDTATHTRTETQTTETSPRASSRAIQNQTPAICARAVQSSTKTCRESCGTNLMPVWHRLGRQREQEKSKLKRAMKSEGKVSFPFFFSVVDSSSGSSCLVGTLPYVRTHHRAYDWLQGDQPSDPIGGMLLLSRAGKGPVVAALSSAVNWKHFSSSSRVDVEIGTAEIAGRTVQCHVLAFYQSSRLFYQSSRLFLFSVIVDGPTHDNIR